jgi:hypothetical protein
VTRWATRTTGYRAGKVIRSTTRYFDWGPLDPEPSAPVSTMATGMSSMADENSPRSSRPCPESPDSPLSEDKIGNRKHRADFAFVLPDAAQHESGPSHARTLIASGHSGHSGQQREREHILATANAGHDRDIVDPRLPPGHMPRGYGRCPGCREFTWLPEGPEDGVCDACAQLADAGNVPTRR